MITISIMSNNQPTNGNIRSANSKCLHLVIRSGTRMEDEILKFSILRVWLITPLLLRMSCQ